MQLFGTGTRYDLEIFHQCDKRVKTKSQNVLGAKSNVCRSYRGKTGRGDLFGTPILNRVNEFSFSVIEVAGIYCTFFLNNSETVKTVTLAFCSI